LQLPSGEVRWVRVLAAAVLSPEGAPTGYVGTVEDITQGKLSEEELRASREQLRAFAAHLQSIREEERKLITREIHDELGQALTGFKMDLAWMRNRLQSEELDTIKQSLLDKIKTVGGLIDGTANLVRKLCTELRPGVLDDLGLTAAIEWQAREYQGRTGIICDVKVDLGDLVVDPDRSTALFRIFQEILTNVARHAQATKVEVMMKTTGAEVLLEVKDNGRGIKPGEIAGSKSLGLLGMRERAIILGGEVEISGAPGNGTTVSVKVPLPEFESDAAKATLKAESGVNGSTRAKINLKPKKRKAIH
jgi:signal transduction histidine kinase